jgi:hypothetical protein
MSRAASSARPLSCHVTAPCRGLVRQSCPVAQGPFNSDDDAAALSPAMMATVIRAVKIIPSKTVFLICDIQTKFRAQARVRPSSFISQTVLTVGRLSVVAVTTCVDSTLGSGLSISLLHVACLVLTILA